MSSLTCAQMFGFLFQFISNLSICEFTREAVSCHLQSQTAQNHLKRVPLYFLSRFVNFKVFPRVWINCKFFLNNVNAKLKELGNEADAPSRLK